MSVAEEFATVDAVLASGAETRGVDAFALAVIKAERQIRKLFTHLIFQYPAFSSGDVRALRESLAENRGVYFEGLLAGFDALYPRSVRELVGPEHQRLEDRLKEAIDHRNKIFHGQLTKPSLSREDLLAYVADIRAWCCALADSALAEIGYDGFARNSFRKSAIPDIWKSFRMQLSSVEDYAKFIREHMQRSNKPLQRAAPSQPERRR